MTDPNDAGMDAVQRRLMFEDEAVWVFLLRDKTQVQKIMIDFFALIQRQFEKQVKIVRNDNGSEFIVMKEYFRASGIIHQTSCVGTLQQNGRVERKHRHILNVARALRFQANLPIELWGYCASSAAYLINRTPSMLHNGKSPYEIIFGKVPAYSEIRVFGCLAYAHNQKRHGDKFASRSRKCVFLEYPYAKKGWNLFDLETREVFVSRDVTFIEERFPYLEQKDQVDEPPNSDLRTLFVDDSVGFDDISHVLTRDTVTQTPVVSDKVGEEDICILVDENDRVVGHDTKYNCHLMEKIEAENLLHRAFSVFLFNSKYELLLQQRSKTKVTFPLVWTNTCCSHPLYRESELIEENVLGVRNAAQRKLLDELGIVAKDVPVDEFTALGRMLYKAPSDGKWGEHELDYLLFIVRDVKVQPNPDEVADIKYVSREELKELVKKADAGDEAVKLSPWFRLVVDNFLMNWWDHVEKGTLIEAADMKTIHKL